MRKVYAILLLLIFLLYHAGYYGIYLTSLYQLDHLWEDRIIHENAEQHVGKTLMVSIPMTIPYQADQADYQPAFGTFEVEGKYYRIIKQRYARDTLHIMYVNDTTLEELDQALEDWIASFAQQPTSEKGDKQLQKPFKDFLPFSSSWKTASLSESYQLSYGSYALHAYETALTVYSPPPEA